MIIHLLPVLHSKIHVISIKVFAQFRCLLHISVYDSDVDLIRSLTPRTRRGLLNCSFIQFSSQQTQLELGIKGAPLPIYPNCHRHATKERYDQDPNHVSHTPSKQNQNQTRLTCVRGSSSTSLKALKATSPALGLTPTLLAASIPILKSLTLNAGANARL